MRGAMPPTSSWRSAWLSTGTTIPFLFVGRKERREEWTYCFSGFTYFVLVAVIILASSRIAVAIFRWGGTTGGTVKTMIKAVGGNEF